MPKDNRGGKRTSRAITPDNIKFPKNVNEKQQEAIRSVVRLIPEFDYYGDKNNYEIKRLDIDVRQIGDYDKYSVGVVIETGMKNDEGTLASIIARKRRQFWVGDNGGYKVMGKGYKNKRVSRFELLNKYWES